MRKRRKSSATTSEDLSTFYRGRRCLVTGAGGFIGSHLSEALVKQGARVKALVHYNSASSIGNLAYVEKPLRAEMEIVYGDIADPFNVDGIINGMDVVFHLAALVGIPYSYIAPQQYITTNIMGTMNVVEASRKHAVGKTIVTSTSETYGTARYVPQDENHPLQGQSPYAATKIGADKLVESYFLSFKMPVATIRPFNAYGPRQSLRAIIPTIIAQALHRPEIHVGNLSPKRDFTFVSDTVRGFMAVAASDRTVGEVVQIGSGASVSIGEVIEVVQDVLGVNKEIVVEDQRVRPEGSEVAELLCDNSKSKELAGWEPTVNLRRGLEVTADWLASHVDRFDVDRYAV